VSALSVRVAVTGSMAGTLHNVFGTASQYTCTMKTFHITVFGMNWKRFGFSDGSGAQSDILINCAT